MPLSATQQYRPDIDGLRALAVLLVVAYHAFPKWVRAGFIGVDIFFVISGFLITRILLTEMNVGNFTFSSFYARRIKRIFPALIVTLVATIVLCFIFLLPDDLRSLGSHVMAGSGFLSNFLLYFESGYFEAEAETKPLLHLWSLAVEEQFYFVWPIFLLLIAKAKLKAAPFIVAILLASFVGNISLVGHNPSAAFYLPFSRFWELSIGALLACSVVEKKYFPLRLSNAASLLGMALIAVAIVYLDKSKSFPGYWALLPTLGAGLIILSGCTQHGFTANNGPWFSKTVLSHRLAVWIGLISFPLYLWHWVILFVFNELDIAYPTPNYNRLARCAALLIAVALSWLTYRFIEQYTRHTSSYKVPIALVALLLIVGLSGALFSYNNGFPERFSKNDEFLVLKTKDFNWGRYVQKEQCFMDETDRRRRLASCISNKHPMVLLWGDSHAAALYPGLAKAQTQYEFGLTQMTYSMCGPFFSLKKVLNRKDCNAANEDVLRQASQFKPDIVVLHSAWEHRQYPLTLDEIKLKTRESIERITQALPQARIVVVGPVPHWEPSLLKVVAKYVRDNPDAELPVELASSLVQKNIALDHAVSLATKNTKAIYISSLDAMCSGSMCKIRTGPLKTDLTAIDYGHLSKAGSEYLVDQIANQLLHGINPRTAQINSSGNSN